MTEVRDAAERFSELLSRRLFVDHEPGSLPVWVDADSGHVAALVRQVEARHPAARFGVQRAGAAVAVRMTAREQELADFEAATSAGRCSWGVRRRSFTWWSAVVPSGWGR